LPGWDTRLTTAMHVRIIALSEKLVTQKMPLPAPVVRQPDANMEKDEETVEQSGSEGLIEAVVKLRFEDGKQVAADIITEKVLTDAVPEIVRVGTRDMVETSRGNMRFRSVHWMAGSAYLPTDGSGRGITACGLRARQGIVAVDPAVIPLGSRLYIPGYGMALAADTGGAIVGNRIDLCMESRRAAMSFGRRQVKVYIIDE